MGISQTKAAMAFEYVEKGFSHQYIANLMGVSVETIHRYLRAAKQKDTPIDMPKDAKILIFDIETALMELWAFAIRQQYIQHTQIKEEWYVLSWSAKWLFDNNMMSDCVTPEESLAKDDSRVLNGIHNLFEEANIVIAHNALGFDIKKLQYRFAVHGYFKPSPYAVVDTLRQAQRHFAASSHKLDHLQRTFGLSKKDPTNLDLWIRCGMGDQEALDYMLKYNKSDVRALEGLYLFLRPWLTSHPNVAMLMGIKGNACGKCGSKELDWSITAYPTPAGRYKAARCYDCGSIVRSRFSDMSKEERANTLVDVAR